MGKITSNELSESLNDLIDEKLNTEEYSLMTENKTIVGAINEIYGKEIIANAIGDPLNRSDTFTEMSSDINNLLSTFKTNMINNGVTVESGDKFKQLIDKIATLADNEGKGIKYAEGAIDSINISDEYYDGATKTIDINIDFNPTMIVICGDISNRQLTVDNVTVSSTVAYDENNRVAIYGHLTGAVVYVYIQNITQTSFDICVAGNVTFKNFKWYAIGVGEGEISKGMQYASGNGTISSLPYNSSGYGTYVINTNLDFTPTVLFWTVESLDYQGEYGKKTGWKLYETANSLINVSSSTCLKCSLSDAAYDCNFYLSNINSKSFTLNYEIQLVSYSDAWTENVVYRWYAIGAGETPKGMQYAEGAYEDFTLWLTTSGSSVEVPCELNFTPTLIFVKFDSINNTSGTTITNAVISSKGSSRFYMNYGLLCGIENISSNGFSIFSSYGDNSNITFRGITWYAMGN